MVKKWKQNENLGQKCKKWGAIKKTKKNEKMKKMCSEEPVIFGFSILYLFHNCK